MLNSVKRLLTGRVNELLRETEYPTPPVEFGSYRGGSIVFPVITLSACERSEKERIIRMDTYTLTIAFTVPEHPDGERNCYAYAGAVTVALRENPTLGGAADRKEICPTETKRSRGGLGYHPDPAGYYRGGRTMTVQGCDCLIVIKTRCREMGVPYAEETIADERTAAGEAVKLYIWHEGGR